MSPGGIALLVGAGLTAGAVNSVAGGGSLISFPSLVAYGLPPLGANVTNSVALWPGYAGSAFGGRADLTRQRGRVLRLTLTCVAGALVGCGLLLGTPSAAFDKVVPFLVLLASGLLAFQPRLQRLIGHPAQVGPRRRALTLQGTAFLGAIYGSYFGGALGVILLGVLALVVDDDLRRLNALKNVLSTVIGTVALVVFALFGPVGWSEVAVIAPCALLGGYVGAQLARRLSPTVLRWTVVVFGVTVAVILMIRSY